MGVLETLDDYEEPIAYDLICLGLRLRWLGTPQLTWGDLLAIIRQGPNTTALFRALNPEDHLWGLPELLLAEIADGERAAVWQRGGGKRKDRPEPIPRPGVGQKETQTYGKDALPLDEMAAWLGWTTEEMN